MSEKNSEGLDASNLEESGLNQDLAHWAEVLDRWVKGIDTRLGRNGSGGEVPGLDGNAQPLDGGPPELFTSEIVADRGEP